MSSSGSEGKRVVEEGPTGSLLLLLIIVRRKVSKHFKVTTKLVHCLFFSTKPVTSLASTTFFTSKVRVVLEFSHFDLLLFLRLATSDGGCVEAVSAASSSPPRETQPGR